MGEVTEAACACSCDDLLTVIVPVYNVAQYLERCLQSVLEQTYRNFELIVVNDGSTDDSPAICRDFASKDSRILLIEQENKSLSCARNAALDRARGDYVCFIDSDDWVEPTYLERLHAAMAHEGVDISICGYYDVEEDETVIREVRFEEGVSNEHGYWRGVFSESAPNIFVWNKMYRISLVKDMRFIPGKTAQDNPYNLEAFARANKVWDVNAPLYHYRHRPQSISASPSLNTNLDVLEFDVAIYNHLEQRGYYDCLPDVLLRALNHLARKSTAEGDAEAEKIYQESKKAIDEALQREGRRGTLPFSLRMKHLAYEVFGASGYRWLSSMYHRGADHERG